MPKKNNKQDDQKSHALLNTLIVLMLILFWLGFFSVIIKLDIGGLGNLLRPVLGDIPIVNQILPTLSDAELAEEKDYPYNNLSEAIGRIKELESQLALMEGQTDDSVNMLAKLQAEIDRLKVFEDNQLEFEERVSTFDNNVVFADEAPEISEYKQYYEEINPENAAKIYEQVIKQLQYDDATKEKAEIFRKMKAKDAASILEEMTADTESVAQILMCMESKYSSLILAEMDRTNAAKITKKMLDLDAERLSEMQ